MQFMVNIRALEYSTEPRTLRLCIGRKVEYDGNAHRQESANVRLERILQSGRALDESRYISDLARIQAIQELVLDQENGIFSLGQISRESRFPCRHLAAHENQLRCGAHALNAERPGSAAARSAGRGNRLLGGVQNATAAESKC
jgi:hypothetical protein